MLFKSKKNEVSIIRLSGVISSEGKKVLSLRNVKKLIDKGFANKKAKAIVFIINSPGGSPVQSEMIANYVMRKSEERKIKVISFVEDVAASGGYWLSLMGNEIYALSKSSIVGSLGVVYASFGLEDFIKKHGITRRVHTAGKNKVSLDIFQEEKEEDIVRLKDLLKEVHKHFKDWVLKRRGTKIKLQEEELFSGKFWLASTALEYGLVDEVVDDMESKLKELYGRNIKLNYVEGKKSLFPLSLFGSSKEDTLEKIIDKIKAESMWNKFGI